MIDEYATTLRPRPASVQEEARALGDRVRRARLQGWCCDACTQPVTTAVGDRLLCGSCATVHEARRLRRGPLAPR